MVGFPHIALIDPRTGMKVWGYQGYLGPPEFIEKGDINGEAGAVVHSFVACLRRMVIDNGSLMRRKRVSSFVACDSGYRCRTLL